LTKNPGGQADRSEKSGKKEGRKKKGVKGDTLLSEIGGTRKRQVLGRWVEEKSRGWEEAKQEKAPV